MTDATRRRLRQSLPGPLFHTVKRARSLVRRIVGARRLRRRLQQGGTIRLVIGSERRAAPAGWIETDLEYLDLLRPEQWAGYFSKSSIDAILAEHVWEHLSLADGLIAAQTCHTFLRPGGYLRVAVPDGHHPDPGYREMVRVGGSGCGAHDHKVLYTHESLQRLMESAGFEVEMQEYFDAAGEFHACDWDPADGMIQRSRRFDERNRDGQLRYTSLILDARKPA